MINRSKNEPKKLTNFTNDNYLSCYFHFELQTVYLNRNRSEKIFEVLKPRG